MIFFVCGKTLNLSRTRKNCLNLTALSTHMWTKCKRIVCVATNFFDKTDTNQSILGLISTVAPKLTLMYVLDLQVGEVAL